jgi:hypothetical protein
MAERSTTMTRWLVPVLVVMLAFTACVMFATGDLVMHPWTKHSRGGAHTAGKLPVGIGTMSASLTVPAPVGLLSALAASTVTSTGLRPPFVPPRA